MTNDILDAHLEVGDQVLVIDRVAVLAPGLPQDEQLPVELPLDRRGHPHHLSPVSAEVVNLHTLLVPLETDKRTGVLEDVSIPRRGLGILPPPGPGVRDI